jgi:hypothetical protein
VAVVGNNSSIEEKHISNGGSSADSLYGPCSLAFQSQVQILSHRPTITKDSSCFSVSPEQIPKQQAIAY